MLLQSYRRDRLRLIPHAFQARNAYFDDELNATFLLIEHDMPLIMGISDTIFALASGAVLAEGTPQEVQSNPEVIESYLGGSLEAAS